MRFVEVMNAVGKRLHIGIIMAAGSDWVEVSMPERERLVGDLEVRFLPSTLAHSVRTSWRTTDRVGFVYRNGGPPEDLLSGRGAIDPRSASQKLGE